MNDPDKSIGFLVSDVARLLRRNFNRRAQPLGLSQAQSRVLAYLSRREGVKQVTLADTLEIQPITLARSIDGLESLGLVERRPDPEDRRAVRLYLTEAAKPHLARMWELAAQTRAEALAGLSEETVAQVLEALRRMKSNLLEVERTACEREEDENRPSGNAKRFA